MSYKMNNAEQKERELIEKLTVLSVTSLKLEEIREEEDNYEDSEYNNQEDTKSCAEYSLDSLELKSNLYESSMGLESIKRGLKHSFAQLCAESPASYSHKQNKHTTYKTTNTSVLHGYTAPTQKFFRPKSRQAKQKKEKLQRVCNRQNQKPKSYLCQFREQLLMPGSRLEKTDSLETICGSSVSSIDSTVEYMQRTALQPEDENQMYELVHNYEESKHLSTAMVSTDGYLIHFNRNEHNVMEFNELGEPTPWTDGDPCYADLGQLVISAGESSIPFIAPLTLNSCGMINTPSEHRQYSNQQGGNGGIESGGCGVGSTSKKTNSITSESSGVTGGRQKIDQRRNSHPTDLNTNQNRNIKSTNYTENRLKSKPKSDYLLSTSAPRLGGLGPNTNKSKLNLLRKRRDYGNEIASRNRKIISKAKSKIQSVNINGSPSDTENNNNKMVKISFGKIVDRISSDGFVSMGNNSTTESDLIKSDDKFNYSMRMSSARRRKSASSTSTNLSKTIWTMKKRPSSRAYHLKTSPRPTSSSRMPRQPLKTPRSLTYSAYDNTEGETELKYLRERHKFGMRLAEQIKKFTLSGKKPMN